MHEEVSVLLVGQRKRAQPVDQPTPVRGIENFLQRVGVVLGPNPCIDRQQVQIVIAQQRHRAARLDQRSHCAQGGERLRAAIDEVADEDQPARVGKLCLQGFEAGEAALQVADRKGAHARHRTG